MASTTGPASGGGTWGVSLVAVPREVQGEQPWGARRSVRLPKNTPLLLASALASSRGHALCVGRRVHVAPGTTSVRLAPTMLGGMAASALILAANALARASGWTDLDLPTVLGLTFRRPGQTGLALAGTAWYFMTGGVLVPTLYWLLLRRLGRSGPVEGALLGMLHILVASGLLALTEPGRARRERGEGRPMGALLSHYGWLERTANVAAHLAYGLVVASAAGATHSRAPRSSADKPLFRTGRSRPSFV